MKSIFVLILSLGIANSVYASSFEIKISNYDSTDVIKTADSLMEEVKYFLDKPLNWCEVKPVGEITILWKRSQESRLKMEFEVQCDHEEPRKKLKAFWGKYENFLYKNMDLVDTRIQRMYPDFNLLMGEAINSYMFIKFRRLNAYGGSLGFHNKNVFFRLKFGDDFETIPLRMNMPGEMLTIIGSNTISNSTHYSFVYYFKVPTEILKSENLNIEIDRIWHLVNRQEFIRPDHKTEYKH